MRVPVNDCLRGFLQIACEKDESLAAARLCYSQGEEVGSSCLQDMLCNTEMKTDRQDLTKTKSPSTIKPGTTVTRILFRMQVL